MHQSVRDYWITFNDPLEGRVNHMYLDWKGWVSTGIGNKIDETEQENSPANDVERAKSLGLANELRWLHENGEEATPDEVAADWDAVKARLDLAPQGHRAFKPLTSLHIEDSDIDRHVEKVLDRMEAYLVGQRPEFVDFESWPANAQLATLSMCWALGAAFRFPNFQGHVAVRNWIGAADESHFTPDVGTIRIRNKLDHAHFLLAQTVEDQGLPPELIALDLSDVFGVQGGLLALGYKPLGQDGADGPQTQAAVSAFQGDNGLQQNGSSNDPDTVAVLTSLLTGQGFQVL